MSTGPNRLLDDLARLATEGLGAAQGLKREGMEAMRHLVERLMQELDVPTREEIDIVRAMALKAREENEALHARIVALEQQIGKSPATL
jgi:BMFP domain-containing protein YqiC